MMKRAMAAFLASAWFFEIPGRAQAIRSSASIKAASGSMEQYFLIVRSVVPPARRPAFDHWYRTDHMPKAMVQLGAHTGRRYWSDSEPGVHYAVYGFKDIETPRQVKRRSDGPGGTLTHEFSTTWPDVVRTREVIAAAA